MNRVRALAIRSSRKVAGPVVGIANWLREASTSPVVELQAVARRLELLLAAMYGTRFEVGPVGDSTPRNTFHLRKRRQIARHEGAAIKLPATMEAEDGPSAAMARYRLLAIEQAARIVRGSAAQAPVGTDAMLRDLYNIREAVAIDASIAETSPGIASLVAAERKSALGARPSHVRLSERERAVERVVLSVLKSPPQVIPGELLAGDSPEDSLDWARRTAASLTAIHDGEYRGALPPVAMWGETLSGESSNATGEHAGYGALVPPSPGYGSGESAMPSPGADDSMQELGAGGPNAARSPDDAHAVDDDDNDALSADTLTDSGADASPPGAHDNGDVRAGNRSSTARNATDAAIAAMARSGTGILYPEWDCNAGAYRDLGAVVHPGASLDGDGLWSSRVLGEHPALVRRVRREFERLRARRVRMLRQREGEDLDLAACVRALSELLAGDAPDDRLYMAVRAARRPMAVTVLVDVSGSTSDPVTDGRRVIDVEKTTLLLASEAFDALGDAYSILTFCSDGAPHVRVATVKGFHEPNGDPVRRRIAGIEAGGNTRLGAAIRHATDLLSAQPAGHRLLLILSDGKPNDVDRYFTTYAIEDSRRAILEARSEGVYPFCITIDANDPDAYLDRVFGTAGYTILRRPEQLPAALLEMVRHLLRGGGA